MLDTHRRGIRSSEVREIIVIALGILLAFGIEAAWTAFRESAEVRQQLSAVDAEIAQNLLSLQKLEDEHRRVAVAGAALVKMMGPDAQVDEPDSVARLIGIFWTPAGSVTSSQGALETFRSSGLLAEVSDPDIRDALATWADLLGSVRDFNISTDARLQEVISPLLHQYVSEGDLNRIAGFEHDFLHIREEYRALVPSSRFNSDYSGLLQDRPFENLVAQRVALSLIGADLAAETQTEASRILDLLREY